MRKPLLACSAVEHGIFLTAKYPDYAEGRKAERKIRTSLCVIVRIPSFWRILLVKLRFINGEFRVFCSSNSI